MRLSLGGTADWQPIYETIKDSNIRCGSLFVDLDVGEMILNEDLMKKLINDGISFQMPDGKVYEACICGNGGVIIS